MSALRGRLQGEIEYTDSFGHRRVADINDHTELQGFLGLESLVDDIARLVEPGDWVIDLGANVGLVTSQLCRLVGPSGVVWAVEPLPVNVARLQFMKEANRLDQLKIFEAAASSSSGEAELRLPEGGESGWGSLTASWNRGGKLRVETRAVDDLVQGEPETRRLSMIKIDVEGMEPDVIAGAATTLAERRPMVVCEFNDLLLRDRGTSSAELLQLWQNNGYRPVDPRATGGEWLAGRNRDLVLEPTRPG